MLSGRRRLTQVVTVGSLLTLIGPPLGAQVVSTIADSGAGSLREAIEAANSDGVPSAITFAGGLAGQAIQLLSPLPLLSEADTSIDGDLGGDCDPDIGLDGGGAIATALSAQAGGTLIRGLAIYNFTGTAVDLNGDSALECSSVGTNLALADDVGNEGTGVVARGADNRIGPGNAIAFNGGHGVQIEDLFTNAYPEFTALSADYAGVFPVIDFTDSCATFHSADNIVPLDGGGKPFTENFGMRLTGTLTVGSAGTYTFALPNLDDLARLTVDGNELIDWQGGGTPPPADLALGVGGHTIRLEFLEGGGAARLDLDISGPASPTLATEGNTGGCPSGQPGLCGELFQLRLPSEGNTVTQNAIHDNFNLGIALNCCCGPVPNDGGDGDVGANTLLNHPLITSVAYAGTPGQYTVSGVAPANALVEVFLRDDDPTGFGEGPAYIGSATALGDGSFAASAAALFPGAELTATATDALGNTSEFGPAFDPPATADVATVPAVAGSHLPGATVVIPLYIRDRSLTPLGADRPSGSEIQGWKFQLQVAPAAAVGSLVYSRAGIVAPATPGSEGTFYAAGTGIFSGAYNDPLPFTVDTAAPGDQVGKLTLVLAAAAPAGALTFTWDAAATELRNEADAFGAPPSEDPETQGAGTLALVSGSVTVASNAAIGLVATAQSSSEVLLAWGDPELSETGFRLERSLDGSSYSPVINLGPDATSHLDTGLSAATLYYYRVITLIGASVDSQSSNVAAATTFPAAAAQVCVERVSADRGWARNPSAAYRGPEWAVAWQGRDDGDQDDIFFQRLDSASLAPIGSPVNVSASDMVSGSPTLVWNGSHYGLVWFESMRAEPGVSTSATMFSLLNPDGTPARGGVRLTSGPADILLGSVGGQTALAWDGTHWGLFLATVNDAGLSPLDDIVYRRLEEDGDLAIGPVVVGATAGHYELDLAVAWAAPVSKHGLAWVRYLNGSAEIYFQRVEETTGAPVGSPVQLATGAPGASMAGLSIVWDGNGWAVAWSQFDPALSEGPLYLRRVDAAGSPAGPAERLSRAFDPDDPPDDGVPVVRTKPGGGYAIFTGSIEESTNFGLEIGRFEATAAGSPDGALELMTPVDDATSYQPRVAEDGNRFLVVFHDSGAGALEVAGLLVDADGASPPGLPVQLTAGHTLGNSFAFRPPGTPAVAPLGAGFVALWTDVATTAVSELRGRIYDGAGAVVADLDPLSANGVGGAFGLVGVGDTFAVAWRQGNTVRFGRYGPSGSLLGTETLVTTTAAGGGARTTVAWSGESYGVLWRQNNGLHFRRLMPDGTPSGAEVLLFPGFSQQIEWVGTGWAIAFQQADSNLAYALLDAAGAVVVPPTPLTAIGSPPAGIGMFDLHWTGQYLGIAWAESKGLDPPDSDLYFTVLDRASGAKAFPEVLAVGTGWSEVNPILYFADGRFHLAFQGGNGPGTEEIEIETNGTLVPGSRFLTSRGGIFAVASNGVTAGLAWRGDGLQDLYFETTACLNDSTAPPCPALSAAMQGGRVALGWSPVTDPESGIWRYNLYRDGAMLAELFPVTVAASDGGFNLGQVHQYQLRAQNGAFQESESCPLVPFLAHSGLFYTLPPCRVFDSRFAPDQPALADGVIRSIPFPGDCGVPATARAVVVNVTAVVPGGTGRLTLFPGDVAASDTSVVSFNGGQTRASAAVIGLAADGTGVLKILPTVSGGGSVDVIVDVSGYFE